MLSIRGPGRRRHGGDASASVSVQSSSSSAAAGEHVRRLADRSCAEKMEKPAERTNIQQTAGQCQVDRKQCRVRHSEHAVMCCETTHSSTNSRTTQLCKKPILELVPRTPMCFSLSSYRMSILFHPYSRRKMTKRFRVYKKNEKRSLILQWSVGRQTVSPQRLDSCSK